MPILTVRRADGERRISFVSGPSLRRILDAAGAGVRSGCSGIGGCGLCRVSIEKGNVGAPNTAERLHLNTEELARGIRLACQVIPEEDLWVTIPAPAPESVWRPLDIDRERCKRLPEEDLRQDLPQGVQRPCGAAVDVGPIDIGLSLCDLGDGKRLAGRYGPYAPDDPDPDDAAESTNDPESLLGGIALGRRTLEAVKEGLWDIAVREGIDLGRVVRVALVGNAAAETSSSDRARGRPEPARDWVGQWAIHPEAEVEIVPPLKEQGGSHLLAGVMASGLLEDESPGLFMDLGFASGIALWDGRVLRVTSPAKNPPFAGSAINRVRQTASGSEGSGFAVEGAQLIDVIARLVGSRVLSPTGRFTSTVPQEGFSLVHDERTIVLTQEDVTEFQETKAAVCGAVRVLEAKAGLGNEDLQRICVSGTFSRRLNVAGAQAIGLLPCIPSDRIELCGNTALLGCEEALLCPSSVQRLKDVGERAELIHLTNCPEFDDFFVENLYLGPV